LVSEGDQNNFATGLNDPLALGFPPTWFPSNCPSFADADQLDNVLHFLQFAAWRNDPVANPPVNTGLAGVNRIVIVPGFIGTVALEADDGGCSTNGDADSNDAVFRWTSTVTPLAPFTDQNQLLATIAVGGNALGVTDLGDKFVIIVSEADDDRNHDQDPGTDNFLLAWLDPALGANAVWNFDNDSTKAGVQALGVNWMADRPQRDYVLFSLQEKLAGKSLNKHDKDQFDSVPAWGKFTTGAAPELVVRWGPAALADLNAGIVMAGDNVFFRGNQVADHHKYVHSKFGQGSDVVLRTTISHRRIDYISPVNSAFNTDVIVTDGKYGAALLVDEWNAQFDYNKNKTINFGDPQHVIPDFSVRWFPFH
jgi:hypothetical protein